ncbi:hypothetical protein MSAR_24740 [Mycolicibacterium sarraceniae]|uniref:O-antigen polymerase n=2 Tax=Mycolicibacterium sarraceniae TaxID=1534348 RepID=A0A7I7SRA5_9MYCO|nr:hypothetical protein MSAR_24740 [Mycolicibacterium sarraceniae]
MSYGARQAENAHLWIAIPEAPIVGHGFGYAYQPAFGRANSFTATYGPYYAHNFYLWLLAKSGIIGLGGFALFALIPIVRGLRTPLVEAKASAAFAAIYLAVCVVSPAGESGTAAMVLGIALGAAMTFSRKPIPALPSLMSQNPHSYGSTSRQLAGGNAEASDPSEHLIESAGGSHKGLVS